MPIVIKEIRVKATVSAAKSEKSIGHHELLQIKREVLNEVKDYLHKEYLRKYER